MREYIAFTTFFCVCILFSFCFADQAFAVRYSARRFDARGAPKKTMTGCGAWGIILLIVVIWQAIANANTSFVRTSPDDGNKKPFDSSKYIYSWTGPNALARSALVERQERLQYNCELESSDVDMNKSIALNPESFRNILVDNSHELLYCYVPKVRDLLPCYQDCDIIHNSTDRARFYAFNKKWRILNRNDFVF